MLIHPITRFNIAIPTIQKRLSLNTRVQTKAVSTQQSRIQKHYTLNMLFLEKESTETQVARQEENRETQTLLNPIFKPFFFWEAFQRRRAVGKINYLIRVLIDSNGKMTDLEIPGLWKGVKLVRGAFLEDVCLFERGSWFWFLNEWCLCWCVLVWGWCNVIWNTG